MANPGCGGGNCVTLTSMHLRCGRGPDSSGTMQECLSHFRLRRGCMLSSLETILRIVDLVPADRRPGAHLLCKSTDNHSCRNHCTPRRCCSFNHGHLLHGCGSRTPAPITNKHDSPSFRCIPPPLPACTRTRRLSTHPMNPLPRCTASYRESIACSKQRLAPGSGHNATQELQGPYPLTAVHTEEIHPWQDRPSELGSPSCCS